MTSSLRHCDVIQKSAQINPTKAITTEIHLSSVRSNYLPNAKSPSNKPCHGNILFIFVHLVKKKLSMTSNRLQNKLLKKIKGSTIVKFFVKIWSDLLPLKLLFG